MDAGAALRHSSERMAETDLERTSILCVNRGSDCFSTTSAPLEARSVRPAKNGFPPLRFALHAQQAPRSAGSRASGPDVSREIERAKLPTSKLPTSIKP